MDKKDKRQWTIKSPENNFYILSVYRGWSTDLDKNGHHYETQWSVELNLDNGNTICATHLMMQDDIMPSLHEAVSAVSSEMNKLFFIAIAQGKEIE